MEFGRMNEQALGPVNFTLGVEPAGNLKVLGGKKKENVHVYVGCPRWACRDWVGKIYPKGTKSAEFLDQYIRQFNCIELNTTHYQIYTASAIEKWATKANGMDFRFCPKFPQSISHDSDFIDVKEQTDAFIEGILAFGSHLGPSFLQVSDKYSPAKKERLFNYLASLPRNVTYFLEVRHPDWFVEPVRKELFNTLYSLGIGAVITDTPGRRDCVHMHLTVPKTFVRFVCNSLHPTDFSRSDEWIERIQHWLESGLEELYFFIHMPDETYAPELSVYFIDKLNAACGLNLQKPVIIQPGLLARGTQIKFF